MTDFKKSLWHYSLIVIFLYLLTFFGESLNPILEYNRVAIQNGELWRLIFSHIIHLNTAHFFLNVAVLAIILFFLKIDVSYYQQAVFFTGACLFISLGLYFFSPEVITCVGLSGVLYSFLVWLLMEKSLKDRLFLLPLAVMLIKVFMQQTPTYDVNYLQPYIAAPVVVGAHLYGIIFGGLFFLAKQLFCIKKVPSTLSV